MQYYMISIVAWRTDSAMSETEIEHSPATVKAMSSEQAKRKGDSTAEDKWPQADGWSHSVSKPVLITALVKALTIGVN